jgi:hypothetical protein
LQIKCNKPGYEPILLEGIEIERGLHSKKDLILKPAAVKNRQLKIAESKNPRINCGFSAPLTVEFSVMVSNRLRAIW